jgi:PAS domain S-box-containing protein
MDKSREKIMMELMDLKSENEKLRILVGENNQKIKDLNDSFIYRSKWFTDLNRYSIELSDKPDKNTSSFIISEFKSFFKVKEVWISNFDRNKSELVIEATTLSENDNSLLVRKLGRSIVDFRSKVDEMQYAKMIEEGIGEPSSLFDISFGQIPALLSSALEKLFGLGWFQGIALSVKGNLFGTLVFAGYKGQKHLQKDELQIFSEITSNVLRRRYVEKELVVSEKRFRQLSELLPQLIYEADIKGNITFSNQSGLNMLGYSEEELRAGINLLDLVADEDRELVLLRMREIINGSEKSPNEYYLQKKSGEKFPVLIHNVMIQENGMVTGLRGIGIDMTDLKEVENALKRKAEELERFNKLMLGREIKMIELKKEINQLLKDTGKQERYKIHEL